jgi:hypothetical protein
MQEWLICMGPGAREIIEAFFRMLGKAGWTVFEIVIEILGGTPKLPFAIRV